MNDASRLPAKSAPADAVLPGAASFVAPPAGGFLGIVMLDTRFPRPPGDIGHPDTFAMPTRRRIVPGAWPRAVVGSAAALQASGLLPAFVAAVQQLQEEGARAITTSCGFLVLLQAQLEAAARVPVVTSSLLQLPALLAAQAQVGVLTISARDLGDEHLRAAGVEGDRLRDVVVQGVPEDGALATALLGNHETLDLAAAQAEVVAAARALQRRAPQLRTVVLECTNMPPYAQAVHAVTGLDVRSLLQDARLLQPFATVNRP